MFLCTCLQIEVFTCTQVTEDVFDLCHGNALCVLVSESYGVVCIVSGVVKCVTCRFGARTCEHVKHVMKLVDSDDTLAPLLQKFAKALTVTCPTKVKPSPTCLSLTRIPVNFTNTEASYETAQQYTIKS